MKKANASQAAQQTAPEAKQADQASGLPLFFTKPAVINPTRHGKAGLIPNQPLNFARTTNSIPLNVTEFIEAAKFYPIVYTTGEQIIPLAITGLEKQNYFITKDGNWQSSVYVPAYVRKYPFVFLEDKEKNQLTLCIDEDAPQFAMDLDKKEGIRLFDGEKPTEFTNNALKFCGAYQEEFRLTQNFTNLLKELDLLSPNQTNAELRASGRKISLGGFQLVDQEKFGKLPDAKILELHKQGWLPLFHYGFMSQSNWRRLLDFAAVSESAQ